MEFKESSLLKFRSLRSSRFWNSGDMHTYFQRVSPCTGVCLWNTRPTEPEAKIQLYWVSRREHRNVARTLFYSQFFEDVLLCKRAWCSTIVEGPPLCPSKNKMFGGCRCLQKTADLAKKPQKNPPLQKKTENNRRTFVPLRLERKQKGNFVKVWFWCMYPRSGFLYRRSIVCALVALLDTVVPFFVPSFQFWGSRGHLPKPPFWKPPLCEPPNPHVQTFCRISIFSGEEQGKYKHKPFALVRVQVTRRTNKRSTRWNDSGNYLGKSCFELKSVHQQKPLSLRNPALAFRRIFLKNDLIFACFWFPWSVQTQSQSCLIFCPDSEICSPIAMGKKKHTSTNHFVIKHCLLGTPCFEPKIPFQKSLCGSSFAFFPGNEAHQIFSVGQNGGFQVGAKKLTLREKYMSHVPFRPFILGRLRFRQGCSLVSLKLSKRRNIPYVLARNWYINNLSGVFQYSYWN